MTMGLDIAWTSIELVLFLGWCLGWFAFRSPSRSDSLSEPDPLLLVSIIIPARNEEKNLPHLLKSLSFANRPFWLKEIIVVDDSSEDRTAAIAREWGARLITGRPLESGWTGKTWALHQGVIEASGNVFIFLDADTRFCQDGLTKWVGLFSSLPRGHAQSILPDFKWELFYENLSALFYLSMAWGTRTLGKTRPSERRLVGQSLIIRREDYLRAGGHATVRGEILENLFFSLQLQQAQVAVQSIPGRGILEIRMFPNGLRQLILGWQKSFAKGSRAISARALSESAFWMTCAIIVALQLALVPSWLAVVNYLAFVIQITVLIGRLGTFSLWVAPLYPVFLFFYQWVFFSSILRIWRGRKVEWKGRSIAATQRGDST